MEESTRAAGMEALRRLDQVIGTGSDVTHDDVQAAVTCVVAFRNGMIGEYRQGRADRSRLDAANALVSLAYGAEFPLTGFHLRRFEQTRDALKALIGAAA